MQNKQPKDETKYHSNGQLSFERIVNEYGAWTEYTYDEAGNRLLLENSDGAWYKCTYNENGNTLTLSDSDGYFTEWTYDEAGNELTRKDSNTK